jgi:hypothetical protein
MAEMNPDHTVYQATDPNIVYSTPDSQLVHVLYGGQGAPDGPGHGHVIYNPVQDKIIHDRPPGG